MFNEFIDFVRKIYGTKKAIPLHEPKFIGNEKKYLKQCIDTSFVSSVGKFVDKLEKKIETFNYSSIEWRPLNYIDLNKDQSQQIIEVLTSLEELDDVQNIFTNANLYNL